MRTDVLIVGAGLAGTTVALSLSKRRTDLDVTMITKEFLGDCASSKAKGGIAIPNKGIPSDAEIHIHDTLITGKGLCNESTVRTFIGQAHEALEFLENHGVSFDTDGMGNYSLAREGGHSVARILRIADSTGRHVMDSMHASVLSHLPINVREQCRLIELTRTDSQEWCACVYNPQTRELESIIARCVVLATGGMGQVFRCTTNPSSATGDGLYIAYTLGIPIDGLEWMQFHPTSFKNSIGENDSHELITEALRGAGAHIVDENSRRFLFDHDVRGELAPRLTVSNAIQDHLRTSSTSSVFLDCRHISQSLLQKSFPSFCLACKSRDLDPSKDLVPIKPSAHYQCGGIRTSIDGCTSIDLLYAVGECANTGMHGADRLASNSLLEAVVVGIRAGRSISEKLDFGNERPRELCESCLSLDQALSTTGFHFNQYVHKSITRVSELYASAITQSSMSKEEQFRQISRLKHT